MNDLVDLVLNSLETLLDSIGKLGCSLLAHTAQESTMLMSALRQSFGPTGGDMGWVYGEPRTALAPGPPRALRGHAL